MNPPTGTTEGAALYKHQQRLVDELPRRKALVWSVGTGKSLAAIACANKYPGASSLLVVCPKGLTVKWERDLKKFSSLPWVVLSKENFKKKAPVCSVVIFDEIHNHLGISSAIGRATQRYTKSLGVLAVLGLSATVYRGKNPWDVYCLWTILGRQLGYWSFRKKFFYDLRLGNRTVPMPREALAPILRKMIADVSSIVRLEDCLDVPGQSYEEIFVDKTEEQEKAISSMTDWEPLLRCIREQQICGGVGDGGVPIETAKDEALLSVLEGATRSVVVAKFRSEMDRLEKEVLPKLNRPIGIIHGDVPPEGRDAILTRMRESDEFVLLINAQTAEGWELEVADTMVFYSRSWSLVSNVQAEGRIQRITHIKKNTYVSLIVRDSVDEAVYECIGKKKDFTEKLYNGHREKTTE